jgi:predicted phosphodiesterase
MKLAHFSDIHYGHSASDAVWLDKMIEHAVTSGVDHIVISGDLLDHANLKDLKKIIPIFKKHGVFDSKRLTLVPGNHDILGVSKHRKRAIIKESILSRKLRRDRFVSEFEGLTVSCQKGPHKSAAFMKTVKDVALIGIDTTCLRYWTRGVVGKSQLKDVAHLIRAARKSKKFPIVVGHHRPIAVDLEDTPAIYQLHAKVMREDMNLIDGEKLLATIKSAGCDLYLCGHWHVMPMYEHYAKEDGVRVWTQGRSGAVDQKRNPRRSYDLVTIYRGRVSRRTKTVQL